MIQGWSTAPGRFPHANSGAGTYEKAVDMATKDMLAAGPNCIQYANGARHTLKDYADMAIRMAAKRAYSQGEGEMRQEWDKQVANKDETGIIKSENVKEDVEVHRIGRLDKSIYNCITDDIVTDEVIITDERIAHIKERHPNDYERFCSYISKIIEEPDYIIKANKPNTATILKEVVVKYLHNKEILYRRE